MFTSGVMTGMRMHITKTGLRAEPGGTVERGFSCIPRLCVEIRFHALLPRSSQRLACTDLQKWLPWLSSREESLIDSTESKSKMLRWR